MVILTDDPVAAVVGVDCTQRLLPAWHTVTQRVKLEMTDADKRQLEGGVEWIGILLLAAIGLVVVPKNKLLRAREAAQRTLDHQVTFGEYRALVGLLEHIRFVTSLRAETTNALYEPHRQEAKSQEGPSALVIPTDLMRTILRTWTSTLMSCASAIVTVVFSESATERIEGANTIVAGSSDAAGDGRGTTGFGGYVHGCYWRVVLSSELLSLMHITAWETLAACVNILVVARLAGSKAVLALQVDALLTPFAIGNQRSKSRDVQGMLRRLLDLPWYTEDIARRLVLRHLKGDGNVPSDLTSRGLWDELASLCRALRVRPMLTVLNELERSFVIGTMQDAARRSDRQLDPEEMQNIFLDSQPRQMNDSAAAPLDQPSLFTVHSDQTPPRAIPRRSREFSNEALHANPSRVLRTTAEIADVLDALDAELDQ